MTTTAVPLVLDVQGRAIPLPAGARLTAALLPMLTPSVTGGPVAQVSANPNNPTQLGLQNLTSQSWPVRMADGSERQVLPSQTLGLTEGMMLQWGGVICQVRFALAPIPVVNPGQPGPANGFEQPQWQTPQAQTGPVRPHQTPLAAPTGSLGMSQLMPLLSTSSRPKLKTLLVPGLILCIFIALLFATHGQAYIDVLGTFLVVAMFMVVYQLCGKSKPWWVFLLTAVVTMFLMGLFMVFGYFFDTPPNLLGFGIVGLREELLKSLPVFAALWVGLHAKAPWNDRMGVREPLDGILIAAASASGFTFAETLGQYVPKALHDGGEAAGLELLVPRILGEITGHIAYSGYFGYFIGLSALMPKHRVKLLLIGFLTSAGLHAIWDTFANNVILIVVIGILSFACLAAAIVKARQLSPGRAQNFATQMYKTP